MTKEAEAEFKQFCNRLSVWAHKWRDVMRCPNCGHNIFMTDRTDSSSENESIVDYLCFTGELPFWVECKGQRNTRRFPLSEFADKQENFLKSWHEKGVGAFVFILCGFGRPGPPSGRKAYLAKWSEWNIFAEDARRAGMKSIPAPEFAMSREVLTMNDFSQYSLAWLAGGWTITEKHPHFDFLTRGAP